MIMARLIDAGEFDVISYKETVGYTDCFDSGVLYVLELIDAAPEIDAVPVVRCKNCAVPHNKYTGCPKLNGLVTPPDFYCPFGERKDGAD